VVVIRPALIDVAVISTDNVKVENRGRVVDVGPDMVSGGATRGNALPEEETLAVERVGRF